MSKKNQMKCHSLAKISVTYMAFTLGLAMLGGTTIQGHIFWLVIAGYRVNIFTEIIPYILRFIAENSSGIDIALGGTYILLMDPCIF